jgi:hypothetical protein
MRKQTGVSLSEVLISLFLSSLIITILMQFYLSSKHQYSEAQEILATSFDVRWVRDLMSDSIRRAGFTPCLGIDQLTVEDRRYNGAAIHALSVKNQPQQLIQINRMNEHFAKVLAIQSSTQIVASQTVVFNEKRPLLIADCEHAEVHQIFSIQPYADRVLVTLDKPLQFTYTSSTYIGEFLEERWFIKKNSEGKETLHYQLTQTEEITPLIHSLKIHIQNLHEKTFIEVIMGLAEGKTQKLLVAVRGL